MHLLRQKKKKKIKKHLFEHLKRLTKIPLKFLSKRYIKTHICDFRCFIINLTFFHLHKNCNKTSNTFHFVNNSIIDVNTNSKSKINSSEGISKFVTIRLY